MSGAYSTHSIHQEAVVENHIVAQLVAAQGYEERPPSAYDKPLAMDRELVLRFIQTTQEEAWARLEDHYAGSAETEFFKRLEQALAARGTLHVLRDGIKLVPNITFSLCYFRPASSLNPELVDLYERNVLSAIRQVRYSAKNENAIDVVLFLNGLPVVTMEVKNTPTGQTVRHAERQYRKDRSPSGEPLLTFKRGALVHFALDQTRVSMTTRLVNGKTRFLPFNRGVEGGAGNDEIPGEFPIAYLYQDLPGAPAVLSREVFLDLVGRFIHLEKGDGREVMIFPRFHQLDAVRSILASARRQGAGQNYLVQHSAGSGKSNTIAWTAHQIINLHDQADQPIFDTAIIVTDRVVLDRQLQNTVASFEKTKGVVQKIDGTSRDLKAAIQSGARIIITTIQKFGTDHLQELSGQSGRRFAVIIDEAHSSQSGKSAQAMADALTRETADTDNVEDLILEYQRARGPQANISFLAFTATPRNVTLERFGVSGVDGKPHPFHLYSMRQAIEENFILDVLQNYMTYRAYYELEKAVEDDPEFESRRAQRKVARFASLHPTAIDQKVEVIVEHFRAHVQGDLEGQAKAMVVTQSREHALRYWQGLGRYIEKRGYDNLKALVAFSDALDIDGVQWTEAEANGFPETELPRRFDSDEFQILVVAEKYQTGFDQPKLCAMYVDRPLNGLQAVQTLSRLNRTAPGKERTYVLDFRNSQEDIQTAFKPFFEVTQLEDRSDPNQIYDLSQRIKSAPYIDPAEVERFSRRFFSGPLETADRIALEGYVRHAVGRFMLDEDEAAQEEFRQLLKSFMRFYVFVAQIIRLEDTELEKLYAYVSWLARLLPARDRPADIEISEDMLDLKAFRVDQTAEGSASLAPGDTATLQPITEFGANPYSEEEERSLSEIIESFNERHGTTFSPEDFLFGEQANRELLDGDMLEMLQNNPANVVFGAFSQEFMRQMIRQFQKSSQMRSIVMSDTKARGQLTRHFFQRAQRAAREARG